MDLQGSGFYSYGVTGLSFTCEHCGVVNEKVDGYSDDDRTLWGECIKCDDLTELKDSDD